MGSLGIAAKDEDLVVGQLVDPVGRDAVGIIGTGIGAVHGHFHLTALVSVKVTVHALIVGALGRTVTVPAVGRTQIIVVKRHDMIDGQLHGHLYHIVARTHVGERPALLLKLLDEFAQGLA